MTPMEANRLTGNPSILQKQEKQQQNKSAY